MIMRWTYHVLALISHIARPIWARVLSLVLLTLLITTGVRPARAQESWDAVYLAGAKVGYIHTFVEPVKDQGRDLVRVRVDMKLTLKRLDDTVTMELRYGTIETPDGSVLRLDTRTLASTQEIRAHGDVVDGQMTLILENSGQAQRLVIPWGPEVRGPYAVEQSLSRTPIKLGETRKLKMFMPDLNKVCDVTLMRRGDGGRSAWRADQAIAPEGRAEDHTRWQAPSGV